MLAGPTSCCPHSAVLPFPGSCASLAALVPRAHKHKPIQHRGAPQGRVKHASANFRSRRGRPAPVCHRRAARRTRPGGGPTRRPAHMWAPSRGPWARRHGSCRPSRAARGWNARPGLGLSPPARHPLGVPGDAPGLAPGGAWALRRGLHTRGQDRGLGRDESGLPLALQWASGGGSRPNRRVHRPARQNPTRNVILRHALRQHAQPNQSKK